MTTRIGINGFGRIGRQVLRATMERHPGKLEVVAVNDLTDAKTNAHLFKYDTVYGRYPGKVEALEGAIAIDGREVRVDITAERLSTLLGVTLEEAVGRGLTIYTPPNHMSRSEWDAIRPLLKVERFGSKRVARLLATTAEDLLRQQLRVYGGTDEGTSLYLSLPLNFTQTSDGRWYALLSDGDLLWKVWVDLPDGSVEIVSEELPGHFA